MLNSRKVSYEEAAQYAKEKGLTYLETSAKNGENVNETFLMLASKIIELIDNKVIDPYAEVI